MAADRTALTTGTPTIFARYTEPSTGRVVEHLVSSVTVPTGTSQVNGQFGFQYLDLTLDGRTISGSVNPPTNTDVILLVNQAATIETQVPLFAVGTNGIVNAPTQTEVNNNEFLRADNTWQSVLSMIGDALAIEDGTDTWTFTADVATRSLTLDLNGTNAMRLTRQADGTVDLAVTGNVTGNATIT